MNGSFRETSIQVSASVEYSSPSAPGRTQVHDVMVVARVEAWRVYSFRE